MFGTTMLKTAHRWLLIRPGEPPEAQHIVDNDEVRALLGGGIDFGSLSRHFHYAVYEWSITENWPLNAHMHRGEFDVLIRGPVLIHKSDDIGETISLTQRDIVTINALWEAARRGENPDSLTLEKAPNE